MCAPASARLRCIGHRRSESRTGTVLTENGRPVKESGRNSKRFPASLLSTRIQTLPRGGGTKRKEKKWLESQDDTL